MRTEEELVFLLSISMLSFVTLACVSRNCIRPPDFAQAG